MKVILFLFSFLCLSGIAFSQNDNIAVQDTNTYRVIKTDGGELIGKIISQDAREVLLKTLDNREVYIPQHLISEIVIVNSYEFNKEGEFKGEDKFATRYFLTTNGLPVKRGEHYVQWNLFGPNFQFGLDNNLGVGILTSWVGIPVIGSIKKSWELGKKSQFAVGALVGTASWAALDVGGVLPFGTLSFGDRSKNIAITGGYGAIWADGDADGRALASIAGMTKVSKKISLVLDSFILIPELGEPGLALFTPGIRYHQGEGKAFQVGFTGAFINGEGIPVPIPMVQWYRTL